MALLRPCSTSAGFMATPEQAKHLDLGALKQRLEEAGYRIMLDARVLLLVRKDVESTIYANGKVLLKTTDRREAEQAFADLEEHLGA